MYNNACFTCTCTCKHNHNEGIFIALLHEVSQHLTLVPLLIRRINHSWNHLSSLGTYMYIVQLNCCHFGAYTCRASQTQQPTLPSQVPIYTPGLREAIMVKCLAQGHMHRGRGRGSNPHSDDSDAIRTQIQCTKPLGHGTPLTHYLQLLMTVIPIILTTVWLWGLNHRVAILVYYYTSLWESQCEADVKYRLLPKKNCDFLHDGTWSGNQTNMDVL